MHVGPIVHILSHVQWNLRMKDPLCRKVIHVWGSCRSEPPDPELSIMIITLTNSSILWSLFCVELNSTCARYFIVIQCKCQVQSAVTLCQGASFQVHTLSFTRNTTQQSAAECASVHGCVHIKRDTKWVGNFIRHHTFAAECGPTTTCFCRSGFLEQRKSRMVYIQWKQKNHDHPPGYFQPTST